MPRKQEKQLRNFSTAVRGWCLGKIYMYKVMVKQDKKQLIMNVTMLKLTNLMYLTDNINNFGFCFIVKIVDVIHYYPNTDYMM